MNIKKKQGLIYKFKDSFALQLLLCIILCFVIIFIFLIFNKEIDKKQFREYNIVSSLELMNSVEDIQIKNDNVILSGYGFLFDRNSSDSLISLFLINEETKHEVWFEMEQQYRSDLNSYYDCEYDYGNSGFVATTDISNINKDEVYEIIMNIDYKASSDKEKQRKTVSTQQYLLNNEILPYNPNEFDNSNMDVNSELLKEVFSKGELLFNKKDYDIYIYQYNKKLYWITTNSFEFKEDGNTYIPYLLHTSHVNRLPEDKIKYKYDNLDFFFEQQEYKKEDTTPFRVAIRDIPQEYAITYIDTGVYDIKNERWLWTISFHININEMLK